MQGNIPQNDDQMGFRVMMTSPHEILNQPMNKAFYLIASGGEHTCVANTAGEVWCWGDNTAGQLGNGSKKETLSAVQVENLAGMGQLSLGTWHSCGLMAQDGA